MKLARLVVGGFAGIALVLATGGHAQARELGTATFYEHADYGGASKQFGGGPGECVNLTPEWARRISSFKSWSHVQLYSAANCWVDAGLPTEGYSPKPEGGWNYVGNTLNDRAMSIRVSG